MGTLADAAITFRVQERARRLSTLEHATRRVVWTPTLLRLVLEELHVLDDVAALVRRRRLEDCRSTARVLAVAVGVCNSWRGDDFSRVLRRLRLSTKPHAQRTNGRLS